MSWFGRLFDRMIGPVTDADERYAAVDREWDERERLNRIIIEREAAADRIDDWEYTWDAMIDDDDDEDDDHDDDEPIRDEWMAIVDDEPS
jgi:hypothetical protein